MTDFTRQLLTWYKRHGRHDLPWQRDVTPYRVWISEIMLQQTQVVTVMPYYERFMQCYPVVESLADADPDEVLHYWSGLGYYSRARNLHKTAQIIKEKFDGSFPGELEQLMQLPGIGRSTAAAILALSMNQPAAILDGNVKRVLSRYHAIREWPGDSSTLKQLWQLAEQHLSKKHPADYTQAIMDLGATVCSRSSPDCGKCPVRSGCLARQEGLQNALPRRKPDRKLPVKQTAFIMIQNDSGAILLQKRPPAGIWGGLWGFPECPADTDVSVWVEQQYGYTVGSIRYEQGLRHTFSHYRLDITPVAMKLVSQQDMARDDQNLYWFSPGGDNRRIGMAAPVRKLVTKHYST